MDEFIKSAAKGMANVPWRGWPDETEGVDTDPQRVEAFDRSGGNQPTEEKKPAMSLKELMESLKDYPVLQSTLLESMTDEEFAACVLLDLDVSAEPTQSESPIEPKLSK